MDESLGTESFLRSQEVKVLPGEMTQKAHLIPKSLATYSIAPGISIVLFGTTTVQGHGSVYFY
jgi:hypothetical protein